MRGPAENAGDVPSTADNLQGPTARRRIEPSAVRRLVADLIRAMAGVGEEAQARYDEALSRLRENPADAVVEIARAEANFRRHDYAGRAALINAASELEDESALAYLHSIIATPIPDEESADPHSFSTVAEETILRTTAIEGLERLAVGGSAAAVEALLQALEEPSISMRRAAVQAILASPDGASLRPRLSTLLPADQQFLLDVRRVDVRDVPQVGDPTRHLAPGAGAEPSPPAPPLPEDRNADDEGVDGSDTPSRRPN